MSARVARGAPGEGMTLRTSATKLEESRGRGSHAIGDDDIVAEAEAEQISLRLRQTFQAKGYVPPVLPAAAMEVHRLTQRADVDVNAVLAALEKDPMLAARVLRIASAPMFGGRPIQSLQGAVVRLGMKQLTQIVWEVAMSMKVFRSKQYQGPMESVRKHSTVHAYMSRLVAHCTSLSAEYAFMCGLLHDVGTAASLLVLSSGGSNAELAPDLLARVLCQVHAEASAMIARLWGLSEDTQVVLGGHHEVVSGGQVHPMIAILSVAEELCEEFGYGAELPRTSSRTDVTSPRAREAARRALGLEDNHLNQLRTKGEVLIAQLAPTLNAGA